MSRAIVMIIVPDPADPKKSYRYAGSGANYRVALSRAIQAASNRIVDYRSDSIRIELAPPRATR